jgi:hypothetical protein
LNIHHWLSYGVEGLTMKPSIARRRSPVTPRSVTCAFALLVAPMSYSFAADTDCKPLFEAMTRLFNTPSHQYLTQTNTATGDKPRASEIINTGKAMYIMVNGTWHNSPVTGAQMQEQEEQNRKNAKVTSCHLVREESLEGVKVTVYSAHTETSHGSSDEQLWISKSDGLLVHENIDMNTDDHGGKSRAEIRVVYTGVEAPTVSQ